MNNIEIKNTEEFGPVVSSRIVADELGKRHSHVIDSLDQILENQNLGSLIIPSTYKVLGQKRGYKEYLLTKDGFTLYMFNIQGHNDFKMAYINKFNEMEKRLTEQPKDSYMIDDPVERAKRWIEEQEERQALENKTQEQEKQIDEYKPKALFADTLESSDNSILVGELAKLISQGGYPIGQNKLFKWLRDNDYLCKSGERYNLPTQRSVDMNLFDIRKRVITNADGSTRVTRTTKVTGKGQTYFVNKFLQ